MNRELIIPIVEKAMEGDAKAFNRLCELCVKDIIYMCTKLTGNLTDGEDAAQDVLLIMYEKLCRLRSADSFFAWISRTIYTTCAGLKRREAVKNPSVPIEGMVDILKEDNIEFLPPEYAESEEKRKLVSEELENIAPQYRRVLLMRYYQGLEPEEISNVLQVPVTQVYSSLYNGRQTLKKKIIERSENNINYNLVLPLGAPSVLTRILQSDMDIVVSSESVGRVISAQPFIAGAPPVAAAGHLVTSRLLTLGTAAMGVLLTAGVFIASLIPLGIFAKADLQSVPQPPVSDSIIYAEPEAEPAPGNSLPGRGEPPKASGEPDNSRSELPVIVPQSPADPEPALPEQSQRPPQSAPAADTEPAPPLQENAPRLVLKTIGGSLAFVNKEGEIIEQGLIYTGYYKAALYSGEVKIAEADIINGAYLLEFYDSEEIDSYKLSIYKITDSHLAFYSGGDEFSTIALNGAQIPPVHITDNIAPECKVFFTLDGQDLPSGSGFIDPAGARLEYSDFSPCELSWLISDKESGEKLHWGTGAAADIPADKCPGSADGSWYEISFTVRDLAGNISSESRDFVLFDNG